MPRNRQGGFAAWQIKCLNITLAKYLRACLGFIFRRKSAPFLPVHTDVPAGFVEKSVIPKQVRDKLCFQFFAFPKIRDKLSHPPKGGHFFTI